VGTLLSLYWDIPVTEEELISLVLDPDTPDLSVSLHELQIVLGQYGLESRGYKMEFEELMQAAARFSPILIHYGKPNKHYSLLLGAAGIGRMRENRSTHADTSKNKSINPGSQTQDNESRYKRPHSTKTGQTTGHHQKPDPTSNGQTGKTSENSTQYVITADPGRGREIMTPKRFNERWSGTVLLVGSRSRTVNTDRIDTVTTEAAERIHQLEDLLWQTSF
jgi:hypothetical protein